MKRCGGDSKWDEIRHEPKYVHQLSRWRNKAGDISYKRSPSTSIVAVPIL